jgi:hypothetical protein
LLTFQRLELNESVLINSIIEQLELNCRDLALDVSILSPLVFKQFSVLALNGKFRSIQVDLFESFQSLSRVNLIVESLDIFFHQIGISWTLALATNCSVYFDENTQLKLVFYKYYTYPDKDFCLFTDWPHHKHVLPFFQPGLNCTKTLKWLIQNYQLHPDLTRVDDV